LLFVISSSVLRALLSHLPSNAHAMRGRYSELMPARAAATASQNAILRDGFAQAHRC
jgi:hypothetical protein